MLMFFPVPVPGTKASVLRLLAHHEAGHAVVGLRVGVGFQFVMVSGNGSSHVMGWPPGDGPRSPRRLENEIVMIQAGLIAQNRYRPNVGEAGSTRDYFEAAGRAGQLCGVQNLGDKRVAKCLAAARKRTEALVEECWPQIRAVARELYVHGRLERSDVRRILEAQ